MALADLRAYAAMVDDGGKEWPSTMRRALDGGTTILDTQSEAERQAMQAMTLDPTSATGQVVDAVRTHRHLAAALLLGFIVLIASWSIALIANLAPI